MKNTALLLSFLLAGASLMPAETGDLNKPGRAAPPTSSAAATRFRFLGGDAERGKAVFITMNCALCHQIKDVDLPRPAGKIKLQLSLAAETRFVKNYEDLIAAITNPKHVVTERYRAILTQQEVQGEIEPFMPDFTDKMTVRQLIDLVTFLHECYGKTLPDYQD